MKTSPSKNHARGKLEAIFIVWNSFPSPYLQQIHAKVEKRNISIKLAMNFSFKLLQPFQTAMWRFGIWLAFTYLTNLLLLFNTIYHLPSTIEREGYGFVPANCTCLHFNMASKQPLEHALVVITLTAVEINNHCPCLSYYCICPNFNVFAQPQPREGELAGHLLGNLWVLNSKRLLVKHHLEWGGITPIPFANVSMLHSAQPCERGFINCWYFKHPPNFMWEEKGVGWALSLLIALAWVLF